jgi:DNA-binding MarR family transcriptional regulator
MTEPGPPPDRGGSCGCGSPPLPAGLRLAQAGAAAAASLQRWLQPLDLDTRQYRVLVTVSDLAGCPQRAITDRLRIPPSRVVAILDGLEARDLIERVPNPTDRRAHALRLTAVGRDLLDRAQPLADDQEEHLLGDLTPAEREALLGLLDRLRLDPLDTDRPPARPSA